VLVGRKQRGCSLNVSSVYYNGSIAAKEAERPEIAAPNAIVKRANFYARRRFVINKCSVRHEVFNWHWGPEWFAIRGDVLARDTYQTLPLRRLRFCLLVRAGLHAEIGNHPLFDDRADEVAAAAAVGLVIA
jgi:hypothetical protein